MSRRTSRTSRTWCKVVLIDIHARRTERHGVRMRHSIWCRRESRVTGKHGRRTHAWIRRFHHRSVHRHRWAHRNWVGEARGLHGRLYCPRLSSRSLTGRMPSNILNPTPRLRRPIEGERVLTSKSSLRIYDLLRGHRRGLDIVTSWHRNWWTMITEFGERRLHLTMGHERRRIVLRMNRCLVAFMEVGWVKFCDDGQHLVVILFCAG